MGPEAESLGPESEELQKAAVRQVILVLIDALRYDFLAPHTHSTQEPIPPFRNNFPTISRELSQHRAQLFHFIADPPTTTLQRLQALLGGSLPTFVDAGRNFGGVSESGDGFDKVEDSWLYQFKRRRSGRSKSVFLGDETWISVVGGDKRASKLFDTVVPVESFEVWDLDGVDDKVLHRLWEFVGPNQTIPTSQDRPDLVVVHFLGVDHAGHRYGPIHPEMTRKLRQMDSVLSRLIEGMQERDVLLVFGDHGMDETGDHGGDSRMEVDAGLIVRTGGGEMEMPLMEYEKRRVLDKVRRKMKRRPRLFGDVDDESMEVWQIDLVPTLSAWFGTPTPFGNLGCLIPELILLGREGNEAQLAGYLHRRVRENAQQVVKYLKAYERETGDLGFVLERTLPLFNRAEMATRIRGNEAEIDVEKLTESTAFYMDFLKDTTEMCRQAWARFDMQFITIGLIVFGLMFLTLCATLLRRSSFNRLQNLIVLLVHMGIFGSNSFVVNEDSIVTFLLQFLLGCLFIQSLVEESGNKTSLKVSAVMILVRMSAVATVCREEQMPKCQPTFQKLPPFGDGVFDFIMSYFAEDTGAKHTHHYSIYIPTVCALFISAIIVPRIISRLLQRRSRDFTWLMFVFLCSASYWGLESLDEHFGKTGGRITARLWIARLGFSISAWQLLKGLVKRQRLRFVLGVFSLTIMTQLPTGAWMLTLALLQLCLLVSFFRAQSEDRRESLAYLMAPILTLLGHHHFFSTGHQATFSSIQFQTGFIGLEAFNYYLSGGLVILNSIGPCIAFSLATSLFQTSGEPCGIALTSLVHVAGTTSSSMMFAMHFRRHLMVWKIFAPRFMLAAIDMFVQGGLLLLVALFNQ